MSIDIVTPPLGESVTEASIATWHKAVGDAVNKDEALLELETDKVSIEVFAPEAGTVSEIIAGEGDTVEIGALLGRMEAGEGAAAAAPEATEAPKAEAALETPAASPAPASSSPAAETLSPAVERVVKENNLDAGSIPATGPKGNITKGDALKVLETGGGAAPQAASAPRDLGPREERVKMTRLRATVARRLKEAQNTAAMLTTYNEADMTNIMAMRNKYKELFLKKHDVKLGFMSFFVKACVNALQEIPAVNAEIDGGDIIYKNHYDIGIAVGAPKGLVVPVLRDAEVKNLAQIESDIGDFGRRARDGKLGIEEMQGGTFTISNGGVYGSLMSSPILNAPQSGILGMHKIQERPMAINGEVVIRPMMYLALSYDHRIVDGKEAVTFLVRVKEALEDPERLLLDI